MRAYNYKISEKANESLRKRETVVRRQKTVLAVVVIVLISLGILFGTTVNALASSKEDVSSFDKYYVSIQIEAGDTLWDIADKYIGNLNISKAEYIDEVCSLNGIYRDDIHAGGYIVVPCYTKGIK